MSNAKQKLEKALDQVTVANHTAVEVPVRVVYVEGPKVIQYGSGEKRASFLKTVVRFVDKKNNGLYAEARHGDKKDAEAFCKRFEAKKCFLLQNCSLSTSSKWFAGYHLDLSMHGQKAIFFPLLVTDDRAKALASCFPESRSDFTGLLEHCQGYQRVDLMGKVMEVDVKEVGRNGKVKGTVWLKDDTGKELQVSTWGPRFADTLKGVKPGDILQVDNATMMKQKDGSVEASVESIFDSEKHSFSALVLNQGSRKLAALVALSSDRGQQISSAWQAAAARGDVLRTMLNKSEAFVGCAATLRTCSLELTEQDRHYLEVVVRSLWVTGVHGQLSFLACDNCGTKIDDMGQCKKAAVGCRTMPKSHETFLAQVDLADFSGKLEKVLVTEKELLALARVESTVQLAKIVEERGPMGICYQGQFDCRLVTQRGMKQWRPSRHVQDAQDLQGECQFQVLWVRNSIGRAVCANSRPMVRKVLRLEGERTEGSVLPVCDLYSDLIFSGGMGVKFRYANIYPDLVVIAAKATDDPSMENAMATDGVELMSVRHAAVWPLSLDGEALKDKRSFVMEAIITFKKSVMYNMMDGQARCLIGRPVVDADTGLITLMTEKMFPLKPAELRALQEETMLVGKILTETQMTHSVQKRSAVELVTETPAKVKVPRWEVTP